MGRERIGVNINARLTAGTLCVGAVDQDGGEVGSGGAGGFQPRKGFQLGRESRGGVDEDAELAGALGANQPLRSRRLLRRHSVGHRAALLAGEDERFRVQG